MRALIPCITIFGLLCGCSEPARKVESAKTSILWVSDSLLSKHHAMEISTLSQYIELKDSGEAFLSQNRRIGVAGLYYHIAEVRRGSEGARAIGLAGCRFGDSLFYFDLRVPDSLATKLDWFAKDSVDASSFVNILHHSLVLEIDSVTSSTLEVTDLWGRPIVKGTAGPPIVTGTMLAFTK